MFIMADNHKKKHSLNDTGHSISIVFRCRGLRCVGMIYVQGCADSYVIGVCMLCGHRHELYIPQIKLGYEKGADFERSLDKG